MSKNSAFKDITFDEDAKPLTTEETIEAVKDLVRKYPKITRSKADPEIRGQQFTNISIHLFDEPKNGVYGLIKPRGCYPNVDDATKEAEKLIKRVESSFKINIYPTGYWSLITNKDDDFALDKHDVNLTEEQEILAKAMKDAEVKEAEVRRELEERKEKLRRGEDDWDGDENSLNYYTTMQVSSRELLGYIRKGEERLKKLKDKLRGKYDKIKELNEAHPEYVDQWLGHYNSSRVKVGLQELTAADIENAEIFGLYPDEE